MARLRKINGNYYAYFYDRTRTPKEKSWPLRCSQKAAARRKLGPLEDAFEAGTFDPWNGPAPRPEPLSLADAVRQFMRSRQHLRPKTVKAYRVATDGLMGVVPAGIRVRDVRPGHVRPYVLAPDVANATQRKRHRHLRAFFNWLLEQDLIGENPCAPIRVPKREKKVPKFLTPEGVERLVTAIEWDYEEKRSRNCIREGHVIWLKDVVLFALGTGLRLGEITALRWRDVDLESEFVVVRSDREHVTKSGHERSVPLVGDALRVLRRLDSERLDDLDGYVFTGYGGGQLNDHYVSKQFRAYRRLAKLPESISFHNLRHSCASWMVMRGVPLSVVQHVLGHSDVAVTQQYAHLAPDAMKQAMQRTFA